MLVIVIVIFTIALDQYSKYLTVQNLKPLGSISLIDGVFSLTYVENIGAAFGIMKNQRWLFIVFTLIVVICVFYFLFKQKNLHMLARISLALIAGGAIGNLIDRMFMGYVVDMFHVTLINFAVFNVADSAVVVGTFILAFYILFIDGKKAKA